MNGRRRGMTAGLVVLATLAVGSYANAQATRTWVSGVGDDANPCSRTAPCKTFAGAISKTAAGGEISVLDPGGFGAVTITKAITIDGSGTFASILASGTNGVVINAAAGDKVVLRSLAINGAGVGLGFRGVKFLAGGTLYVENCTIENFAERGVSFEGGGALFVSDTTVRNVQGIGIDVTPATGLAHATIDGARVEGSGTGIHAKGNATVMIRDTVATGNSADGFWGETAPAQMSIDGSVASQNQHGVHSSDGAVVRISGTTVTNNTAAGLLADTEGALLSFKDNEIAGNVPDGKPTKKLSKR